MPWADESDDTDTQQPVTGHWADEPQPQVDPVKQVTSASAAATADNSWFSPEFRSGALFKDVLGPVATAAQKAAAAVERMLPPLPPLTEEQKQQSFLPNELGPEQGGPAAPPYVQQAFNETVNEVANYKLVPKETMPLYWTGRGLRQAARIFNPQGDPRARDLRTALEAAGGFMEKGSEAIAGLATPFNALLAVAPELLPARLAGLANKGLALYFLKEALNATPSQIRRFNASNDPAEKSGIVAETLVSYVPAAGLWGRGKALRADVRRGAEEQRTTQDSGEAPDLSAGMTKDQFRSWAQTRLDDLTQREGDLSPEDALEAKQLTEGLKEGGDVEAMAAQWQVELSDVTPPAAEGEAGEVAKPAAEAPAAAAEPSEEPAAPVADAGTARYRGQLPELMDRAEFIRAVKGIREDLNAKSPLTDEDISDINQIDDALQAAEQGQHSRIDKLAWDKYGVQLSEGGETSAQQPSDVKVQAPPAAPGDQEGAVSAEPPASDSNNVVGKEEGKETGGTVSPETGTEPVTPEAKVLSPEELANLSVSQREHYLETGELLTPEEAARTRSVNARGLPKDISDELANAEQSAAEGDKEGAKQNLKEVRRLLAKSKRLPKSARDHALNRIAMVEHTIKGDLPPPATRESSDPNVVISNGRPYHRVGYDEKLKLGEWKKEHPERGRLVGNTATRRALDLKWEIRKALDDAAAKEKAGKGKKAAPKAKTAAAPEPTTTPGVAGEGELPVGTKVKHWTWGDAEVTGPGKKKGTTQIRLLTKDNKIFDVNTKALVDYQAEIAPKAEVTPEPDPAADLLKQIHELQDKIIQDKTDALQLKGKQRAAANKAIHKDQIALATLKNKAGKLPKPKPDTSGRTEREITEREQFRKELQGRVKKAKFDKSEVVRPSSTGGEADVIPASSHRGLQIYKEKANIKPWRVSHQGSGELIGHFDNEAEAKAFAVRVHEGTTYDFTKPWEDVKKQIRDPRRSAAFDEMRNDPYAYIPDIAVRLWGRINKDKTPGGFMMNDDIGPEIIEFGRRLYQRGTQFRDWAVNMVKHLGEKIIGSLRSIWDSITGRNLLPGRGERGGASPGGGSMKGQGGQLRKDFLTRAEADAFIKANKGGWQSHSVIEQPGTTMPVQLLYRPNPAPGSGASLGKPVVTASGAIIQPKFNPAMANAPAKVNAATGGTIKPPPPGSALGPTPPGSNPHQVWYQRVLSDWRKAWERYHPGGYASIRLEPKTVVVNTHQRWLAGPANGIWNVLKSPWYEKLQRLTDRQFIDAEHDARYKYLANRAAGQGELQATLNAIKGNPIRDYFIHRMNEMVKEKAAAKTLDVKLPGFIDGPYGARLTEHNNEKLIRIGGGREPVVTQLRRSLGHFDDSRKYESQKDGVQNGVQYRNHLEAILQRERVGEQLKATAQALQDLKDGKVIYAKKADAEAYAKATYKPGDVDVIKMEGFGGKDWYVRNRQEARVIDQNLNNSGPKSQWGTFMRAMNNYARNPNLWNPAPHVTKNMFFKYALARINNLSLKGDTAEFKRMTKAELIDLHHKYFTMPGAKPGTAPVSVLPFKEGWLAHSERIPEMMLSESKKWYDQAARMVGSLNRPSQKYIFEKADPYLRYKLWESYFRKGMHPGEAANNVFFDLIRYDENSGGLNMMKSIPGNFFSTWRVGTYVTMYKAFKTHPIRTLAFFGAVEYLREMIYRRTGQWTHLPIDYMFGPMAEVVESFFRAKKEATMGRSAVKAYGMAAKDVGMILATTGFFGPGGSQAPTTIKDAMGALQGDDVAFQRMANMFWGLSQLFNIPQEYLAYQRDKKPEHLVNILTGAAFGTHTAISYEPRRLGSYLPESLPGMAYDPELKRLAQLRDKAENIQIKAQNTHEARYQFKWVDNSARETQIEQVLRRAGVIKTRQQGAPPPVSAQRGGGRY